MYSDIVDRYRGGYDGAESQGDESRVVVFIATIKDAESEDIEASRSLSLDERASTVTLSFAWGLPNM
jgi:hypothetical protein